MRLGQTTTSSQMVVDTTGIAYVLESNDKNLYAINPNGTPVSGFPKPPPLPNDGGRYFISGFHSAENGFAVSVTGNLYFVGTAQEQPGNPTPPDNADGYLQSLNTTGAQRSGFPIFISTIDSDNASAVSIDAAGANAWVAWHIDLAPAQGFVTRIPAN
jgi:hypothetical protein